MLRARGERWLMVATWHVAAPDKATRLPAAALEQLIAYWLRRPDDRRTLLRMYAAIAAPLEVRPQDWTDRRLAECVVPALRSAFESSRLVGYELDWATLGHGEAPRADPRPAQPSEPPQPAPSRPGRRPPNRPEGDKTWIEISLVDDRDEPIAGIYCRVALPDGAVRLYALDRQGKLHLEDIPPGMCEVEFPDIDGREWNWRGDELGSSNEEPLGPGSSHQVVQGETALRIAVQHGYRRGDTIWDAPENDGLRQLRRSANVLQPGDVVWVPGRKPRVESAATGKGHAFHTILPREHLRVRLEDPEGNPLANVAYRLLFEGGPLAGTTNNSGWIIHDIPVGLRTAKLQLEDRLWSLRIGHIDPVADADSAASSTGAFARFGNLAHHCPRCLGDETLELRVATAAFQYATAGTAEPDDLDPRTREELRQKHRC